VFPWILFFFRSFPLREFALIVVGFLLPLGVYLLLLGRINQRMRPWVVTGVWDAIGLLFAVSGFLILGGPFVMTVLQDRWRLLWIMGESGPVRESLDLYRPGWIAAGLAYFFAVVFLGLWIVRRSRPLTVVYNVEPTEVPDALVQACETLQLEAQPSAEGLLVRQHDRHAVVRMESFDTLKHVTLHWSPEDSPLRPIVEQSLQHQLDVLGAPDHYAGLWITLAGLLVLLTALAVAVIVSIRLSMGY
jgi:hypothetical protein